MRDCHFVFKAPYLFSGVAWHPAGQVLATLQYILLSSLAPQRPVDTAISAVITCNETKRHDGKANFISTTFRYWKAMFSGLKLEGILISL